MTLAPAARSEEPPAVPLPELSTAGLPAARAEVEESSEDTPRLAQSVPTDTVPTGPGSEVETPELRTTEIQMPDSQAPDENKPAEDLAPENRPVDLTPVSLPRRSPNFNRLDSFEAGVLYRLPTRLFFSSTVENSLRAETNIFQTERNATTDMIYRVLPNTTLGYALTRTTRVACNYFFLRDQYTEFNKPLSRNFHSVGFILSQDIPNRSKYNINLNFMSRGLFATMDYLDESFFNDLLPQLGISRPVSNRFGNGVVYLNILGQIRFREVLSKFQEGDQFYSLGYVHWRGPWQFLFDTTLNNNFGSKRLRLGNDNQVFILTQEIARRVHPRINLQTFVRSQEIYNMGASSSPGYAGFNYRIFGGLRFQVSKAPIFPVRMQLASK
ncbi:MAG: hypothetical protein AB7W16_05790 [Candidatus Obscuribacterales bacterium]